MANTVFWAVVVLGVLIFVHELGHFLAARWLGVRVLKFSLGFGPRVWGWREAGGDGTEYILSAIPLGGYVKMLGEGEEDEEGEAGTEAGTAPLPAEEAHRSFANRSVRDRFAIVLAGPMSNFLFAPVALAVAFMIGVGELLPVIGGVNEGMPAQQAGLRAGDRVTHLDERPVTRWRELSETIKASGGKALNLAIERQGEQKIVRVVPKVTTGKNLFGEPVEMSLIGISPGDASEVVRYGVGEAIIKGFEQTWSMIDLTVTSIWKLITRVVAADQIGGPLLIAELAGKTAQQGATSLLFFMALISVNLGILNLLPIPVLDVGHLLFFSIEAVKGSPVGERAHHWATMVGMALLGALMVFAFYNDLMRIFAGAR